MGVEYAHYLLVRNTNWIGSLEIARRIHSILESHHLVAGTPDLFELRGGRKRKLRGRLDTLKALPRNLLVRYPRVDGGSAVAEVMGPSYYPSIGASDRYLQQVSLVIGTDFRIGPSSEALFIEVVRPPFQNGNAVPPYEQPDCMWEFDDSYPADGSTHPPQTRIQAVRKVPVGFTGVWRAGLILDCGKDLPKIGEHGELEINPQFVEEIRTAFEADLFQIGRVY